MGPGRSFWIVISMLFLIAQTAWVRDKIKKISIKQLHKLDNFYMQLSRDREPTAVDKRDGLARTFDELQKEYAESQRQIKEKEDKRGMDRAMQGVGGGDVFAAAQKVTTNWVNMFLDERKEPIEKIQVKVSTSVVRFQETPAAGHENDINRRPASFQMGVEQSQFMVRNLQVTYRILSQRSDIQLEFGNQIKTILNYQVDDDLWTWSLSTGF